MTFCCVSFSFQHLYIYIKGLLTECEVCTGKYFPEVFVQTERRKERGLCEKNEGKYFPVQTEQTRLIRLLHSFWFIFFSVYSAVFVFRCCRLPIPLSFLVPFHVYTR